MLSTTNLSISPNYNPFNTGKYESPIHIQILQSTKSSAIFIQVIGERITLETFQGEYFDHFKECFKDKIQKHEQEFSDMKEIFGDEKSRQYYANGKPQSDDEISKRIEFNAKRASDGNPFTGFAILNNTDRKIIGFVSIGRGFQDGESQSGLILNKDYQRQHYGLEATLLAGALADVYYKNNFKVGSKNNPKPVERFTVTAKDENAAAIQFIQNIGLQPIRPLTQKEQYTTSPSKLYGIEAQNVEKLIEKWMNLKNITFEIAQM